MERRSLAVVSAILAACGGRDAAIAEPDAAPPLDTPSPDGAAVPDADLTCRSWERVPVPIRAVTLLDPAALHVRRPVRVLVTVEHRPCEERSMFLHERVPGSLGLEISAYAWRPAGPDCAGAPQAVERPLLLTLDEPGRWTIAHAGLTLLEVDVGPGPTRACGTSPDGCELDCDCADARRCLGANGPSGPLTACVYPCELDRDCLGRGRCASEPEAVPFACDESVKECGGSPECQVGYACRDQRCEPAFVLDPTTRHECVCDRDCAAPLRCVAPAGEDAPARCELACPTESPGWCEGAHWCGLAAQDIGLLAEVDSVCVWAGE